MLMTEVLPATLAAEEPRVGPHVSYNEKLYSIRRHGFEFSAPTNINIAGNQSLSGGGTPE
jgi:hypothetical protein